MTNWIKLAGICIFSAFLLSSCSLDEGNRGVVYVGYATVWANDKDGFDLILDNNTVMEIGIPMSKYPEGFVFRDNQRVYLSFLILDEQTVQGVLHYVIQVNDIVEIPSKPPVYSSELDGHKPLGNDPIDVVNKWFSMNHLNVIFNIAVGNDPAGHVVDLLVDEDHEGADEDNIYVEIRHNAQGDPSVQTKRSVISFDVAQFLPEGKNSVNVHIKYVRYDGQVVKDYNNVYARTKAESVDPKRGIEMPRLR